MNSTEFDTVMPGDMLITSTAELLSREGENVGTWDNTARMCLGKKVVKVVHVFGNGDQRRVRIDLDGCKYAWNHNDFIGFAPREADEDVVFEDSGMSIVSLCC